MRPASDGNHATRHRRGLCSSSLDQSRISRISNNTVVSVAMTVRIEFQRSQTNSNFSVVADSADSGIESRSWD